MNQTFCYQPKLFGHFGSYERKWTFRSGIATRIQKDKPERENVTERVPQIEGYSNHNLNNQFSHVAADV